MVEEYARQVVREARIVTEILNILAKGREQPDLMNFDEFYDE